MSVPFGSWWIWGWKTVALSTLSSPDGEEWVKEFLETVCAIYLLIAHHVLNGL